MAINYAPRYKDYAIFTPAISRMYSLYLASPKPKRECPFPRDYLDFLKVDSPLFHLPYALYSAGQVAKTHNSAISTKKDMVADRDKSICTVIGDSGGYQIQTNVIKFNGDETRERMLRWLERHCDWSMVLDFPTGGINIGNVDQHTDRLIAEDHDIHDFCRELGWDPTDIQKLGFATCLKQTLINNDYFVKHRKPGATKFLNVVQGRNVEESDVWYDKVKHYDFEGWALASHHRENFEMTMRRLIMMRDSGSLAKKDWLHFLGVGKLANGCVYTTMQRYIREKINPNFTISYDVSSPFTTTAYGNLFMGYTLDKNGWTMQSTKNVDGHKYLEGNPDGETPFLEELKKFWDNKKLHLNANSHFIDTEVGKLLKMKDICINADLKFRSTWDVVAYALLMNHNLQVHLEGVFESQDYYDRLDPEHVPHGLIRLQSLIPEIFSKPTKKAMNMIEKYSNDLNFLAGDLADGGVMDLQLFGMTGVASHRKAIEEVKEATAPSTVSLEMMKNTDLFEGF